MTTELKFGVWSPDEATFWASWVTAGIVDEDGNFTAEYPGIQISSQTDQGWTPTRPTGAVDEDGNPIFEPVPGWHANVRVTGQLADEMTYGLDQYDAEGNLKNVFDRTWAVQIFQLTQQPADLATGFPAGFRNNTGVTYADTRDFSSQANVWA